MNIKIMVKKTTGVLFIIAGLLALVTPFTPGSWLIFVGLGLLGFRVLFWDKIKLWFSVKDTRLPDEQRSAPGGQTEPQRVILFDVYQTLIDIDISDENKKRNEASAWENLTKSLEQYDIRISPTELIKLNNKQQESFYVGKDKKIRHHNFCKILAQVLKNDFDVELPEEKICSLLYGYHKIRRGYARLYPGVAETLALLEKRYTLSVASYTQGCFTKFELKELGIDKLFSYFFYTSEIGFRKASPKFYEHCLRVVGKREEDFMMIGDNYDADVLVPKKLGMKTMWVKNPLTASQYAHLFDQEPTDMINLEEFAKLPEVIERVFT